MGRLNDFSGGNQDSYNELVGLYFKQTAEQLVQMRAAISNGDSDTASRLAHSAAGASATCGMVAIVPVLRRIEHLGQDGKLAAVAALLADVDREFERLKTYLQTHKPIALAG